MNVRVIRDLEGPGNWWSDAETTKGTESARFNLLTAHFWYWCIANKKAYCNEYIEGNMKENTKSLDLFNDIKALVPDGLVVFEDPPDEKKSRSEWILFSDGLISISGCHTEDKTAYPQVQFHTCNQDLVYKVRNLKDKYLTHRPTTKGSIYMLMVNAQGGVSFQYVGTGGEPLEITNYRPEVVEAYERIKAELGADKPSGRLTILNGPPGTGKSYAIRGLLQETPNVVFVIVGSHEVMHLTSPSTLKALLQFKDDQGGDHIVLIVEDADECLRHRDVTNPSAVSAVLNLGDGIIGSLLDIRIVATTNTLIDDLDPAIKRPGRLNTFLNIADITPELANSIYKRLTGNEGTFTKNVILAEVYQAAFDSGWKPAEVKKPKKSMGFGGDQLKSSAY